MNSKKLACPACSSTGMKPSKDRGAFDWFFRALGRAPYRCAWCRKRSFLSASAADEYISAPVTRQAPVAPESPREPVHSEAVHHAPPAVPIRAPRVEEVPVAAAVPEPAPLMYAENGRLRLSGAAFEQIQRRESRAPRSSLTKKASSSAAYLDRERAV